MSDGSVSKMTALNQVLKRVMPAATEDLIATVAHDFSDVWEIAGNHRARVQQILELQGIGDQAKLANLLEDLCYGDCPELTYHVQSMQDTLPALIETLGPGPGSDKS